MMSLRKYTVFFVVLFFFFMSFGDLAYSEQLDPFHSVGVEEDMGWELIERFEATSTGREGDIQTWIVPADGEYRITALGAQGGTGSRAGEGGRGAKMAGEFDLEEGEVIEILVGQEGSVEGNSEGPSGGGGTFVVKENASGEDDIFIIAGGGGGYGVGDTTDHQDVAHGHTETWGKDGVGGDSWGVGGTNGSGGDSAGLGGGGAGFFGDGDGGREGDSFAYLNGGYGGDGGSYPDGGFGGGGSGDTTGWGLGAGGGGYSGGGGAYSSSEADEAAGGGGGSFIHPNATYLEDMSGSGINTGHGLVEIDFFDPVQTEPAVEVTTTTADLQGYLKVGSAEVFFRYREVGEDGWIETDPYNMTDGGSIDETIYDLDPLEKYEFKAVADVNGTEYEAETLVFVTGDVTRTTQLQEDWNVSSTFFEAVSTGPEGEIRTWEVPVDGVYRITASGAQGGDSEEYEGGKGAVMSGVFELEEGQMLNIAIGQKGEGVPDDNNPGGGGGTFVVNGTDEPLIIAGGGGGGGRVDSGLRDANDGTDGRNGGGGDGGEGGVDGEGGEGGGTNRGAGGAGFLSDGGGADAEGGKSWPDLSGGSSGYGGAGGFGGGGEGGSYETTGYGGGGGGYSGGGGGGWTSMDPYEGGGAGSYNNGTDQNNLPGFNEGHGSLEIKMIQSDSFFEAENVTTDRDDLVLVEGEERGHRISYPLPLKDLVRAGDSVITWNSTEPAGTDLTIYTALTDDDELAPTHWNETMDGEAIPGIGGGSNLSEKYLWTKQVLTTNDSEITPSLHELSEAMIDTSPDHIRISPENSTVTAGDTEIYDAILYDEYGNEIQDVTANTSWSIEGSAGGNWTGSVYRSEKVSPSSGWEVLGVYTHEGIQFNDTAVLHVDPAEGHVMDLLAHPEETTAGQTIAPSPMVEVLDEYGNAVEGTEVTVRESGGYTFDDGTTEVQTDTEGLAVFDDLMINEVGAYTLVFDVESIDDDLTSNLFEIVPANADRIEISPEDAVISAGELITFEADAYDVYGNDFDVTDEVDWSIDDGAGGVWEENVYRAEYTGEWSVLGEYTYDGEELSDGTIITIEPADVSFVDIVPEEDQLVKAGDTIEFFAEAYDEYGNLITNDTEEFGWQNADESGLFYETEMGQYEIRASYEEVSSDPTFVTVGHSEADHIEVIPESADVTAGESQEYGVTAWDEYGNEFDVTDEADWSIDGGAGGSWDENTYRSEFAGTWIVTASYEKLTETAVITVEPGEPARLDIDVSEKEVESGDDVVFDATVFDEYDNEIGDVTRDTEWTIEDEAGGVWDGNVYTAENVGVWNVTGVYEGVSSTEELTVEGEDEPEEKPDDIDGLSYWVRFWWLPIVILVVIIFVVVWNKRKDEESEGPEAGKSDSELPPPTPEKEFDSADESTGAAAGGGKKMKKIKRVKKVKKTSGDTARYKKSDEEHPDLLEEDEEELEAEIERLLEDDEHAVDSDADLDAEKEEVSDKSSEEEMGGNLDGIICPGCGSENSEDIEICYRCGKDLKEV